MSVKTLTASQVAHFVTSLKRDQKAIDRQIENYCSQWLSELRELYGEPASACVESYIAILTRGGKRIRGSLALRAYHAYGGASEADALILAQVLEMIHSYLLIVDDFQDKSLIRRGGPTAHQIMTDYHSKSHFRGDSAHFGQSQAINGALLGNHQALLLLGTISSNKLADLSKHLNQTLIATAMGQFYDMYNEVVETVDLTYVYNALEWKTAYYTISNPLYMGGLLANCPQEDQETFSRFGSKAGLAFQMSDDILCTFSDEQESGKPPMDDIREGKRTILVLKTLELASKPDSLFFEQMLGNQQLSQGQFEHCKRIIKDSGALDASLEILSQACDQAIDIIEPSTIPDELKQYLIGLADFLRSRKN